MPRRQAALTRRLAASSPFAERHAMSVAPWADAANTAASSAQPRLPQGSTCARCARPASSRLVSSTRYGRSVLYLRSELVNALVPPAQGT